MSRCIEIKKTITFRKPQGQDAGGGGGGDDDADGGDDGGGGDGDGGDGGGGDGDGGGDGGDGDDDVSESYNNRVLSSMLSFVSSNFFAFIMICKCGQDLQMW